LQAGVCKLKKKKAKCFNQYMIDNVSKEFVITFGTQGHEIAADTLLTTLFTTTSLIQEINKELSPEKKIDIKIKALQQGSFEVVSTIQEATQSATLASGLFSSSSVNYLAGLFTIFVGVIELKKFLKGEAPAQKQDVDTGIKIENINGDVTVFDQKVVNIVLGNQSVNDLVSKQFEKLNSDETVESLTIQSKDVKPFSADRNDFVRLQEKTVVSKDSIKEIIRNEVRLKILKLVWNDGNKWAFVYDGNKISALIKDPDFFLQIDKGEKFAKGDELIADLKIYQIYDPSIDGYVNEDYEIPKVHQHIPRGEQLELI
jgi:hypothetical protein